MSAAAVHGGTDDGLPIVCDFSTNAHPLGPNPFVLAAVRGADVVRYPDPSYRRLRETLTALHGVALERIVIGASASELIWRLTRCFADAAPNGSVVVDEPVFGEYRRAALAMRLAVADASAAWNGRSGRPTLYWICSPNNPGGSLRDEQIARALVRGEPVDAGGAERSAAERVDSAAQPAKARAATVVVDLAYRPFHALLNTTSRAHHPFKLDAPWADGVVQLWSPNKLHGLTGVRAAYAVLPSETGAAINPDAMDALAPSWVLGADGVAMLVAHADDHALNHLSDVNPTLQAWKASQDAALRSAGWTLRDSPLHFGLARPPNIDASTSAAWLAHLREHGIKLRDATSFGLPGWVRLCVRSPGDVARLIECTPRWKSGAFPS